jgi:hypothetical protein
MSGFLYDYSNVWIIWLCVKYSYSSLRKEYDRNMKKAQNWTLKKRPVSEPFTKLLGYNTESLLQNKWSRVIFSNFISVLEH